MELYHVAGSKNDTLINVLDKDQLSVSLKDITLNIQDSQYILDQVLVPAHQALLSKMQKQRGNKNIEELMRIPKTHENFDKIYAICERITTEKDRYAMAYAVREKYVYVSNDSFGTGNIFLYAACKNNKDMVDLMIESGVDIDTRDFFYMSAFFYASFKGHLEIVKLLLAAGIDVNSKTNMNCTALMFASFANHFEVVKYLLTIPGIDVNNINTENCTALIWASLAGNYNVVKLLLTVPGINLFVRNKDNDTALTGASKQGHHDVVQLLRSHGAY